MTAFKLIYLLGLVILLGDYIKGLQRPPPRYSQQYMPHTSFTCRNKIIGSYYADPETDCQLFHVCVSVAGSIQDYRFLCPNDTAFDQESQTCADWYDVDCEAATLYYASDNFDLYRIGSGLESLHYDNIRNEFEPQDHLQRSESNDPIRSPVNSFKSANSRDSKALKKDNTKFNDNQSSSRHEQQVSIDVEKQSNLQENQDNRKKNIRRIHNKNLNNDFTNEYTKVTTILPVLTQTRYNDKFVNQNPTTSTPSQFSTKNIFNSQKFNQYMSTIRPMTNFTSTVKSLGILRNTFNNYATSSQSNLLNNLKYLNNIDVTPKSINFVGTSDADAQSLIGQSNHVSSIINKKNILDNHNSDQGKTAEKQVFYNENSNHFSKNNLRNYSIQNENHHQKYNSSLLHPISTPLNTHENKIKTNFNPDNYEFIKKLGDYSSNIVTTITHAPTTYSSISKKVSSNKQQYDKLVTSTTKSTHVIETNTFKQSKKESFYKDYQNYETSTKNFDVGKSIELGFSPSSINYLAENFKTSPNIRRNTTPTTYNPRNFEVNAYISQSNQIKSTYNPNQSSRKSSTAIKHVEETTTSKMNRKNDYDYAYYDNGPLEYENIELEHVNNNKESVKIT